MPKALLTKVIKAPVPRSDQLETLIDFRITVKQFCDHLDAVGLKDHLDNPILVQELVYKLPPSYKLEWVWYKRVKRDSPTRMVTSSMTEVVYDVSEMSELSSLTMNERR